MLRSVAALVLDDVSMFEFGIMSEVFGIDRTEDGVPAFDFRVCGPEAGVAVNASVGAKIIPEHGLDGLRGADLVAVVPSTLDPGAGRRAYRHEVLAALRRASDDGSILLSLCSGAFVLGEAGLLDGRRCTTHWRHVQRLSERYPVADVDPNVLFVDEGNLITSAGTAAGIDACLHLVRREIGTGAANAIARRMVVPPQRDGGQRQFIEQPIPECTDDALGEVLEWMVEHLEEPQTVPQLARLAGMSVRTFARRFARETGTTPVQWLTLQRVLRARELLERTDLDVDAVADSSGFGNATLLRHHFRKAIGVPPSDYRRTFQYAE